LCGVVYGLNIFDMLYLFEDIETGDKLDAGVSLMN